MSEDHFPAAQQLNATIQIHTEYSGGPVWATGDNVPCIHCGYTWHQHHTQTHEFEKDEKYKGGTDE